MSGRRKLKPPGEAFEAPPRPQDIPSLHDGRIRTVPHIEGQWPVHIFLELKAPVELLRTLQLIVKDLTSTFAPPESLHSFLDGPNLHLSLSRPLYVYTGQRASFASTIKRHLQDYRKFQISLATLAILTNDEGTRSFATCEVGYGYEQLTSLTESINEVLKQQRLPTYYAEPRFHTSIAWWFPNASQDDTLAAKLEKLEAEHGADIRKHLLDVDSIYIKIGKDVTSFSLA